MKKTLFLTLLLSICLTSISFNSKSQTTVTVDGSGNWLAYMNVFDLANNYQFGSGWGLADVKSTINAPMNSVTLQPNFNTYADNPGDPYWRNGTMGNKNMEANTYLEATGLTGQTVTFTGNVLSNTLDAGYTRTAFVKALDPAMGFATVVNQTVPLPANGPFTVSAAIPATPGLIVQYGFTIFGINANPANEAALGSITAGPLAPTPLSLTSFNASLNGDVVDLIWHTEDEEFVKEFQVQHSYDGINFETFDIVKANNEVENNYATTDYSQMNKSYYRLKMIDLDGTYTYSNVVKINRTKSEVNNVFPNPSKGTINIVTATADKQLITIYNSLGLTVGQVNTKDNFTQLDISSYATGVYFVQFENGQITQLIKQ